MSTLDTLYNNREMEKDKRRLFKRLYARFKRP